MKDFLTTHAITFGLLCAVGGAAAVIALIWVVNYIFEDRDGRRD